jgi:hypothetical protein
MPSAGLEPTIPASKRPQTYALDRAATGVSIRICVDCQNIIQGLKLRVKINATVFYVNSVSLFYGIKMV